MRVIALALLAPVTACSAPTDIQSTSAPDAVLSPVCIVDTTAPERLDETLWRNDRRDIDCTQSAWNGLLELGFSHGDWQLHVAIPRRLNAPGAIDLGAGTVALWFFDRTGSCADWAGSITWRDLPDWAVGIEARCGDDPSKAIAGTWSGHRE
jgi:hypothetical protein